MLGILVLVLGQGLRVQGLRVLLGLLGVLNDIGVVVFLLLRLALSVGVVMGLLGLGLLGRGLLLLVGVLLLVLGLVCSLGMLLLGLVLLFLGLIGIDERGMDLIVLLIVMQLVGLYLLLSILPKIVVLTLLLGLGLRLRLGLVGLGVLLGLGAGGH